MLNNDTLATLKAAIPFINTRWDDDIIPTLTDYIAIPNKSLMFDPEWKANGHMDRAVKLFTDWAHAHTLNGMTIDLIEEPDRTPLIVIDIEGQTDNTILLYGHLDKQPEMLGWDDDKSPWEPVQIGDKLYGRGGADDGYALFCALTAIDALQQNNIPHGRCVIVIEASEESGSPDLVHYLDTLKPRIGNPSLIIALDSGCGNYEQLWNTTSLRGVIGGTLSVTVTTEGVHSGLGSGVIPSAMSVTRTLLDRIENSTTCSIIPDFLHADIPADRIEQATQAANILGDEIIQAYPFANQTQPTTPDLTELLLNRTWRPQLSVTGSDGMPAIKDAGNVTLPSLALKLSLRIPPTCDAQAASTAVKTLLESNPPHGATVTYQVDDIGPGWHAPTLAPWLHEASNLASRCFFDKDAAYFGEGGSIPFMGMLGELYPDAQFLITGVLGPKSNAHGPNEFLHIPMAKKLTGAVACVIAAHYASNP